jgi:hypothetical protein
VRGRREKKVGEEDRGRNDANNSQTMMQMNK